MRTHRDGVDGIPWWLHSHRLSGPAVTLNQWDGIETERLIGLDDGTVLFIWMISGQVDDECVYLFAHISDEDADLIARQTRPMEAFLFGVTFLDAVILSVDPADGEGVRIARADLTEMRHPTQFEELVSSLVADAPRATEPWSGAVRYATEFQRAS